MQKLTSSDYRVMPWKNGKGSTLELAVHPPPRGDGVGDFDWRVSIATVANDGPFSSFPGYDRVILVLEGEGMVLSHAPGHEARLGPLEPYRFQGDWTTSCALIGQPVRDFNVMTRRDVCSSSVSVLRLGAGDVTQGLEVVTPGAGVQLLYCHRGRCVVEVPGGGEVMLEAGESVRVERGAGEQGGLEVSGEPESIAVLVGIDRRVSPTRS